MTEISRLPKPLAELWEWQFEGACQDLPSEMFFHPEGERGPRRRNRENAAKAVCATCPGGLSEDDRTMILDRKISASISEAS